MSPATLICTAHLAPARSGPCVRIAVALLMRNVGSEVCYVPDPLRGTRALALHLRYPSGSSRTHVIGDETPPPGTHLLPINRAVPAGGEAVFDIELTRYLEISSAGRYSLELEFRFADGTTWRSPPLEFERMSPAGSYLSVMAADSAGYGYYAVLWQERGPQCQTVLFDDDGHRHDIEGAEIVAHDMPVGAEVVMSQYPAALPFSEYWLAWIAGGQLGVRFYAHGDPELGMAERQHALPDGLAAARLVQPLLADRVPDEGRPHFTVGMISGEQLNAATLTILRLTPDGGIAAGASVQLPGRPVGSWAISPREGERYFVVALEMAAGFRVVAYSSNAQALLGNMRVWHESAGSLMAGDVRADLEGRTFMGLLVSSNAGRIRVTFAAPGMDDATRFPPRREAVTVPEVVESMCARLDATGRLHLLYTSPSPPMSAVAGQERQRGLLLHYVAPSEAAANWSSARSAALQPWSVRLILRPKLRPFLLAYDVDTGPFRQRI